MTDDRVNIKTGEGLRNRLRSLKRTGETWGGLLSRAADALEERERRGGQSGIPVCASCGVAVTTWTVIDGEVRCEEHADLEFDL